ncbi:MULTISPECIES: O-antigen ligase family protein [unclassified Micromonospora]|uniref:O-antigen ligase family protein n=1 Tax=unclassified Micromonospora TaxID=2617518 RepID=UPI0022B6230D|nr:MULTISPECIES: O-antigen ligase family protein [unclassified Micromonospora]MCZ7419883.1 O-antigen ligase family protein [Verrucosispora sp. WMMA2121]WBB89570.1 O-antigen ligase family protein [Verrucosispora sp. WMMC514]
MARRWTAGTLIVGAGTIVAVVAALAVAHPVVAVVAVVIAIVGYLLGRLDGWQRLFAATLVLLIGAVSNIAPLAQVTFYPRYLAAGALVVWTFVGGGSAKIKRLTGWPRLFLGGLWACVALAVASSTWSVVPLLTLQQAGALALLVALVHGLATRRWSSQHRIARDLGTAYVILTAAFVISLAYGAAGATDAWTYGDRFQGIFANPNMLSVLCAVAVPIGWTVYRNSGRLIHLGGVVPATVALIMTESRTALLAILAGACWVIARHGLPTAIRVVSACLAAGAVLHLFNVTSAVTGSQWTEQLAARFTDAEDGDISSGRMVTWQAALDLWKNRPSFGFGYSAGWSLFEYTRQVDLFATEVNMVHNSYLQWLLELGLAGAASLLLVLAACVWAITRVSPVGTNSGLIWLVATGLFVQVTESAMFGTGQPYPYIFWMAMAGLAASALSPPPAASHRTHPGGRMGRSDAYSGPSRNRGPDVRPGVAVLTAVGASGRHRR